MPCIKKQLIKKQFCKCTNIIPFFFIKFVSRSFLKDNKFNNSENKDFQQIELVDNVFLRVENDPFESLT